MSKTRRETADHRREIAPADDTTRAGMDRLLGIAACIAAGCLVILLSWFKLSSVDIGYHLAYGRHFLETGHIVELDPHLYPETAKQFVNANWGSQVVMALMEKIGGAAGLISLRIGLIAIVFACMVGVVRRAGGGWLSIAMAWTLTALAAYERFSMRPELFSYAAMMVLLIVLMRGIQTWRGIATIVLVQLAWTNLHSYFVVGLLMTCAFFLEALWQAWRSRRADESSHNAARSHFKLIAFAFVLQITVCFINPWHYRGATFPFATLAFLQSHDVMGGAGGSTMSAWSDISEFQSPFTFLQQRINYRTLDAYLWLLGIAALGTIAMIWRRRTAHIFVVLILLIMSLQMRRNIAQFAFVAAPLSMAALAALGAHGNIFSRWRKPARSFIALMLILLCSWWSVSICNGNFYYAERRITREFGGGYNEKAFPIRAAKWISDHADALQPQLFVDYFTSSNAIPWLPNKFPIYVDTNTFAYADETLGTAFKLGKGDIPHQLFFKQYDINVVLLHSGPDTQMLIRAIVADRGEWALVYFDEYHLIFVRRIAAHVPLIAANEKTETDLNAQSWIGFLTGPAPTKAMTLGTAVGVPMSLGWHRPAATLMEEAVRLATDYDDAWNYLGVCEGNLGNAAARQRQYNEAKQHWQRAVDCFNTTLRLNPEHAEAAKYLETTRSKLQLMPN